MKRRKVLLIIFATIIWHLGATSDDAARLVVRPDSSIVPADTRVSFFCRADGNPMPNVVWRRNGHIVQDPRYITKSMPNGLSTLRIEPVKLADHNSTISCAADNGVGAPVTADALLTVLQEDDLPDGFPVIEAHPTLKSVEQGRTAHVTCRVKGDPRPKVLWLRDLMPIDVRSHSRYSVSTLGNPGALMIQQAREEDQGRYECVARNSHGVIHSKAAHLYVKVRRVPPYFTYKLEKTYKVGLGGSVNLTCVAVGYPMPRVFWKRKSDDSFLNDPHSAPIGKNVLTLTNVDQTENYTCHAVSRLGDIEASTTVEVKALPPSPKNLKISEVMPSSVRLTWDPLRLDSEPVKKYLVRYRQKNSLNGKDDASSSPAVSSPAYAESGAYREKEVPVVSNSLLIANLEPYTQYEFSILAISSIGRGTLSNPVETQTGEIAPTTAPRKIQARALNRNSILVRWDPPDKPNGQITDYKVFYTNEEQNTPHPLWKTKETKADEQMTTLYNLVAESTYYIQVQARNAQGSGPMSKTATVITKHGIPGQPSGLKARALDSKRIELSWEKPLHSFNIVGYTVRYNTSRESDRELTLTSPVEKVVIDRLDPDTFYSFKVAAKSTRGIGAFCEDVVAKTQQSADYHHVPVPSEPRNIEVVLVNASAVKVSWERPARTNGDLMGYYIYKEKLENGEPIGTKLQTALAIYDANKTSALISDLEPNTEYSFRVSALNRQGDGEYSEAKNIMTGGIPPSEPITQSVSLLGDDPPLRARIEWLAPKVTYNMPITKYVIWYRPADRPNFKQMEVPGTQTFVEINNLLMGREYIIKVAAANDDGLSQNATESLITPAGIPDSEPLNVRYDISDQKMTVTWDPPAVDQRNGNITYYRAVLTPCHPGEKRMEQNVTGRSATFPASPKKAYSFRVAAATMKGLGPYSPVLNIDPNPSALVGPPSNVRVQATSNTSAVVQWDFEEGGPDGGVADGFVIKFIHEPVKGQSDSERWRSQVVMDSKARYLEISQLTVHKPYAFCVLAIRQNRQGQCSDPPVTIEHLQPVHMVSNLHIHSKTNNQVELAWDYNGPSNIQFYVKQTGSKKYIDQHLEEKEMVAPGYHKEANEHDRRLIWDNLRPYMEYRFQVGVRDLSGGTEYWPREVTVRTDSAGPPFVDKPEFIETTTAESALIKLRCASEEYGPISHYWLIVVPGNFTQEDMVKLTSSKGGEMLSRATALKRPHSDSGDDVGVVAKKKKMRTTEGVTIRSKTKRYSSDMPPLDGVYIAAGLSAGEMQQMTRKNRNFVLGDGKTYDGYRNHALEPNSKYRLMMRAFARPERSEPFKFTRPMHEPPSPKYTDSTLSDIFSTKSSPLTRGARSSNIWLLGPIIAVVVILIIVGMLVFWWLRGKKKGIPHGANRHGSITKVALGGINNGMPTETSKLLLGTDAYGRPVMNPYEMTNGNIGGNNIDMYPMGNGMSNYPPVPVPMMQSSGGGLGSHQFSHPPIPISELPAHIDKLKMNNNALFSQEYESIESGQHFTWEYSSMDVNKVKNRYANVVAYDHSRVILSTIDDIPGSDYINANYIDGYERAKTYIATQGPLPETFADFWRMVWEERSATIVMLTKLEERSRIKCDQYWPSRNSSVYGRIQVTLVDTLTLAHYTIRTFTIEHRDEKECREIKHLQYTAWPDHGVPDHPTPFLMFLKRVRTLNDLEAGPIISHCSAGIGRTGAFIVIDCMLERLRYESTVDIFSCVTNLRSQRSYMVQTDDQYVFIHDAVLDAVQSGSTEVPASKLFSHIQMLHQMNYDRVSGLDLEFRTLGTLRNLNSRCDVGNLPVNRQKNRMSMIVPFDSTRVVLQMIPTVEGSDYINASWVDGYTQRNAYIATQAPLPNSVPDFWRMVWEQESSIIAMLNNSNEFGTGRHQEMSCQYWPSESSNKFGSIVVEPVAEYNMTQYILREFKMTDTLTGLSRTVRHFEFTEWPDHCVPNSGEMFIDFINQVHRTKQQFGVDGPICVHCTTGTGRTGVFIALSIIIERMQLEQVVDVFTTVKLLRTERMNMVDDSAQYEFCYQAAGDFLKLNAFDSPYIMQ